MSSRRRITVALVGLIVLVFAGWIVRETTTSTEPEAGLTALSGLPPEAGQTWRLIQAGGPFPYRTDGTVFQNREQRLPGRESGYYREYTVPTPGSEDRGARRLVTGGQAELYYTGDHYASFVQVDPSK
ncbi:guanyl-specific ribonuclease Sa [Amycolatopsis endophytica]|uniref:Guanyl-specific ribonuclease Sa n=1 Tax=Amycolatopsis endophytica TaxID=860233 RepID=A0A853BFW5_9PSEU|nr:ribonuclease domain-containing protein [Amycolatopsis endophytica]NYI93624.1 guanyl-specific ribonuclease Sa [Amycolatopsis endophytica]